MLTSNIKFRKLTTEDIPDILDISKDIWEGHDYIPFVIENWLKNPKCHTFGVFLDLKLVAFANIRHLAREIVWLEGGRVRAEYQKKGFGIEFINYCLKYAKEHGVKIAQYDTSNRNQGSISLARRFGFNKKNEMPIFYTIFNDSAINEVKMQEVPGIIDISSDEAFTVGQTIPNGPENEFCIGWSFVPFNKEILSELKGKWYRFEKAMIWTHDASRSKSTESPEENEYWVILYGESNSAFKLIQGFLYNFQKDGIPRNLKELHVFCHRSLVKEMQLLGLKRLQDDRPNDPPRSVFLFEKVLN